MRVLIVAPYNLLRPAHIEVALKQARVVPSELLLPEQSRGTTDAWLKDFAKKKGWSIRNFDNTDQALKLLSKDNAAVVAVVSPDHPETLEEVAQAEARRVPVYIYRELYRQDPRVNCRFSPVERPDVWLRALTAEQRDFFRRLHTLCKDYNVELKTAPGGTGSFMHFSDGTEFEAIEMDKKSCRVRPRGSFRHRKVPLD